MDELVGTGQIRFRTAAFVRAPAILLLGLYHLQSLLQAAWGLGPLTATCAAAVPLVPAVAAALSVLYKGEVTERTSFLSHASAHS